MAWPWATSGRQPNNQQPCVPQCSEMGAPTPIPEWDGEGIGRGDSRQELTCGDLSPAALDSARPAPASPRPVPASPRELTIAPTSIPNLILAFLAPPLPSRFLAWAVWGWALEKAPGRVGSEVVSGAAGNVCPGIWAEGAGLGGQGRRSSQPQAPASSPVGPTHCVSVPEPTADSESHWASLPPSPTSPSLPAEQVPQVCTGTPQGHCVQDGACGGSPATSLACLAPRLEAELQSQDRGLPDVISWGKDTPELRGLCRSPGGHLWTQGHLGQTSLHGVT